MSDSVERMKPTLSTLILSGGLLCSVFGAVNLIWLYPSFFGLENQPIACTVSLYFVACAVWIWSLRIAVKVDTGAGKRLLATIFWFAICFRAIQVCIPPILEIDLYRYMWDGMVASNGVSPYLYAPNQVLTEDLVIDDPVLAQLTTLATKTPSHHEIVSNVHFAEYTTIYPPVSQLVFAATMWIVPDHASATVHLTAIRFTLVLFDIVTIALVVGLIRMAGMHIGWLVAYAWNPLVIKEIANSGHLDSIAVCFTTAAVLLLLATLTKRDRFPKARFAWAEVGVACLLAAGTAAKLFPVLFVPLFIMLFGRRSWQSGVRFLLSYFVLSTAMMGLMLVENDTVKHALKLPQAETQAGVHEGLNGFLKDWRMNDVVFTFVLENCKPDRQTKINRAWYVVTTNTWRQRLNGFIRTSGWSESPPFFVARLLSVSAFLAIYTVLLVRLHKRMRASKDPHRDVLGTTFLLVATFFVLQPTQNPWYWVWALPFVCFAKNRGWLLVSVFLFAYYFRFLFKFSELEFHFAGNLYQKAGIFDHCVAWLEHLAIFAAIGAGAFLTSYSASTSESIADPTNCPT